MLDTTCPARWVFHTILIPNECPKKKFLGLLLVPLATGAKCVETTKRLSRVRFWEFRNSEGTFTIETQNFFSVKVPSEWPNSIIFHFLVTWAWRKYKTALTGQVLRILQFWGHFHWINSIFWCKRPHRMAKFHCFSLFVMWNWQKRQNSSRGSGFENLAILRALSLNKHKIFLCWFVLQFRNSDSDIIQFRSNSELCQYVTNCDKWYGVGKVFQKEWNLLKTFFFSATQFCVKQQQKPSCSQCLGQF